MSLTVYGRDGQAKGEGGSPQGVVASAYHGTGVNTTTTPVLIPMGIKEFDPFGWLDANGRFTPKIAGYYNVNWRVRLLNGINDGDFWLTLLYKNGTALKQGELATQNAAGDNVVPASVGSALVYLNGLNDYLEVYAYHSHPEATRLSATGAEHSYFQASLVGTSVGVAPEPWHKIGDPGEPAFANGWANYGTNYTPMRFFKDPHGIVRLEGTLTAAANTTVTTALPVGYRPDTFYHEMACRYWTGTAYAMGLLRINSSGVIQIFNNAGSTPTSGHLYEINDKSWRAAG